MSDIGEEEKAERRRQISEAETDGLARIDDDARVAKEKQERLHAARMRKIHADYRKAIGELEKAARRVSREGASPKAKGGTLDGPWCPSIRPNAHLPTSMNGWGGGNAPL